jgi:hypothetical protein
MWRNATRLRRLSWIEDQQHAVARAKENVPAGLFADERETEHVPVELLGDVEIVDVQSRFDEMEDGEHLLLAEQMPL